MAKNFFAGLFVWLRILLTGTTSLVIVSPTDLLEHIFRCTLLGFRNTVTISIRGRSVAFTHESNPVHISSHTLAAITVQSINRSYPVVKHRANFI